MGKRILYVYDLPVDVRARDLGREFERCGPILRCDVPAPRRDARFAYAFVEFEDDRDAADAYRNLHGKTFQGGSIRIEWAKRGPDARRVRFDSKRNGDRRGRSRSRSPIRRSHESDDDRKADRSRSRSRSPQSSPKRRNRSASPVQFSKLPEHEDSI